jgi:putative transposase
MTNHVHLIISSNGSQPLEATIRDLKKFSSRQIIQAIEQNSQESRQKWMLWIFRSAAEHNPNNTRYEFWVQNSHPIELSYTEMISQKLNYIHTNPVEAVIVAKPEEYLYSSAGDYAGLKGMLHIDFID